MSLQEVLETIIKEHKGVSPEIDMNRVRATDKGLIVNYFYDVAKTGEAPISWKTIGKYSEV